MIDMPIYDTPNFIACYQWLRDLEGGFSNNPHDPGGPTVNGISSKWHPEWFDRVIQAKSPEEKECLTKAFYYQEFWCKYGCNVIEDVYVAFEKLETYVHTGPAQAHKIETETLADFGAPDLNEAKESVSCYGPLISALLVVVDWNIHQMHYYLTCRNRDEFAGWAKRCITGLGPLVRAAIKAVKEIRNGR